MRQDYVDKDEKMWNLNTYHPHVCDIHRSDMGVSLFAFVCAVAAVVLLLMD